MRRLLAIAVLPAFLLACGGDSPTDGGNGDGNGNGNGNGGGSPGLSAQVGGQAWNPSTFGGFYQADILQITASDQTRNFGVILAAPSSGNFTVASTASMVVTFSDGSDAWVAGSGLGSGNINISSINATSVSGTFSFVLDPLPGTPTDGTLTISSGSFNITF